MQIGHGELLHAGTQPQRGRAALGPSVGALSGGQMKTGAGVGALGSMRRTRRTQDVLAGAVALVDQSTVGQLVDHRVVTVTVGRLPLRFLIPGHPDLGEVGQLPAGDVVVGTVVEVFNADQESSAGGTGEQPGQQRGAQIADVQIR